jgi:hypothetical protein
MLTLLPRACPLLQQMTEMRPKKESKSNAPPKALVNDEEEGVAKAAAGKDEQPELRKYKWLAALFMSAFLVSISANAGLTIAIVTKTVGTHTQTHVYAVSLTSARLDSAGESVVAKVPCVEVAEAIVSIQNGDADQGLVMIPLGDGEFSTPSMSAAHYQVHEDSFGMEQIFLSGDRNASYSVSCETSMAACETHPGLLCDVLPSAATASSAQALSFEDAFDGDVRRRLNPWYYQEKQRLTAAYLGVCHHQLISCEIELDECSTTLNSGASYSNGFGSDSTGKA